MATPLKDVLRDDAFLIRSVDYGDNDRILSLLSASHGRIELIAHSAKKSVKRFSCLDFLQILDCEFKPNPRGGLGTLLQCGLRQAFDRLREDYTLNILGLHWIRLLAHSVQQGQHIQGIFEIFRRNLEALPQEDPLFADLQFRRSLLGHLGYRLEFSRCLRCLKLKPETHYFYPSEGGAICEECDFTHQGAKVLPSLLSLLAGQTVARVSSRDYQAALGLLQESFQALVGVTWEVPDLFSGVGLSDAVFGSSPRPSA